MNCKACKAEVIIKGGTTQRYELVDKRLDASKYDIPFRCPECGAIKFSHRAINSIVFIWPLMHYIEEASSDIIEIPSHLKYSEYSNFGIVLSYGPGSYVKKKGETKSRWKPVTGLEVGMKVWYDKTVPWMTRVKSAMDGKEHSVVICNFVDISAEIVD